MLKPRVKYANDPSSRHTPRPWPGDDCGVARAMIHLVFGLESSGWHALRLCEGRCLRCAFRHALRRLRGVPPEFLTGPKHLRRSVLWKIAGGTRNVAATLCLIRFAKQLRNAEPAEQNYYGDSGHEKPDPNTGVPTLAHDFGNFFVTCCAVD